MFCVKLLTWSINKHTHLSHKRNSSHCSYKSLNSHQTSLKKHTRHERALTLLSGLLPKCRLDYSDHLCVWLHYSLCEWETSHFHDNRKGYDTFPAQIKFNSSLICSYRHTETEWAEPAGGWHINRLHALKVRLSEHGRQSTQLQRGTSFRYSKIINTLTRDGNHVLLESDSPPSIHPFIHSSHSFIHSFRWLTGLL